MRWRKWQEIRGSALMHLLISQASPLVGNAVGTFATAAILGPDDRGTVAAFVGASTLFGIALSLSLFVGSSRVQLASGLGMRAGVRIQTAALFAAAVLVGAFCLFKLASGRGFESIPVLLVFCGSCLVSMNLLVLRTIQALGEHRQFRDAWLIQSIGYASLSVPIAAFTHSAVWVLACWAFALAMSTAVCVRSFMRLMGDRVPGRSAVREVLKVSGYAHLSAVGFQALYRFDVVILALFSSRSALGVYSVAVASVALVWSVAEAFALRVFAAEGRAEGTGLRARDWSFIKLNALISTAVGILVGVAGSLLLPRLLPEYSGADRIIWILLPGVIAQAPARVALASLQRAGGERWAALLGLVALVCALLYVPGAATGSTSVVAMVSTLVYLVLAALTLLVWRHAHERTLRSRVPVEVLEK